MTSDESRCVSYFQHRIVPPIEFFDAPLWQMWVLQISESEQAVLHAIIALSAIQQAIETKGAPSLTNEMANHDRSGDADDKDKEIEAWRRFGLEQLGRLYAALRSRHALKIRNWESLPYYAVWMFILSEFLLNQYDQTFAHLQNG